MRTGAIAILTAIMMSSATATVFAADSMKHDMQRDLHVMMGMAAGEETTLAPSRHKSVAHIKHDMQSDLHVALGMAADDGVQNISVYSAPAEATVYRP